MVRTVDPVGTLLKGTVGSLHLSALKNRFDWHFSFAMHPKYSIHKKRMVDG